jgi:hypothetical protein
MKAVAPFLRADILHLGDFSLAVLSVSRFADCRVRRITELRAAVCPHFSTPFLSDSFHFPFVFAGLSVLFAGTSPCCNTAEHGTGPEGRAPTLFTLFVLLGGLGKVRRFSATEWAVTVQVGVRTRTCIPIIRKIVHFINRAGIVQSVQTLHYGLVDRIRFPTRARMFFLLYTVQTGSGTQPRTQWVPESPWWWRCWGVKLINWPHPVPSSRSRSPCAFMACHWLIKHRDNFYKVQMEPG